MQEELKIKGKEKRTKESTLDEVKKYRFYFQHQFFYLFDGKQILSKKKIYVRFYLNESAPVFCVIFK